MFIKSFTCGPISTNCYLLASSETKEAAVIDVPPESGKVFLDEIEKAGFHLKMILLTHTHWDHIGDVASLKEQTNAPIYVHKADAKNLSEPGADRIPMIDAIATATPDHLLEGGEKLSLGNLTLEVIHTPGHSPGGVCFYLKKEGVLFAGDTLFHGSIGNLNLPTSNPEQMWPSLEKLAKLPPSTRVLPGHGDETTIGAESWLKDAKNYFGG